MLPDEATHLIGTISEKFKKANHNIYIFSPVLNEYNLIKELKKIAKKEVNITIVTAKTDSLLNRASHLTLFKNISVFTLEALKNNEKYDNIDLKGSFICIDDKELFLLSDTLDTEALKSHYSFALYQKTSCKKKFNVVLKRSTLY